MNDQNDVQSNNKSSDKIQSLLTQYKLYVQMADKINQRREGANRFYVTIITSPGLVLLIATQINPNETLPMSMPIFIGVIGIMLSLFWYGSIDSYKEVSKIKLDVIIDIEKCLPHKGFKIEKDKLTCRKQADTTIGEKAIPWLSAASYALLIFYTIFQHVYAN